MKKKNGFGAGILSLVLVLGFVLTGCDDGSNDDVPNVPNAPSWVEAIAESASSIIISWDSVSGATEYRIYRSTNSIEYELIRSHYDEVTHYTDTWLSANTTYYYRVTAFNYDGESSYSPTASATTSEGVPIPSTPTGVSASANSTSSIIVSWDSVSGAAGYRIYLSSFSYSYGDLIGESTSTSYTNIGLSGGTTYYYSVSAFNSAGESYRSNPINATTFLSAPTGVHASSYNLYEYGECISVSWNGASGATGYKIYRSLNGLEYIEVGSTSEQHYTDTGLSANTTYYYRVTALNNSEESPQSSTASATTSEMIPSTPIGVSASADSTSSIIISWEPVSGATGYKIYHSYFSYDNLIGESTSTSYTDNGLSGGTTYYYSVSAFNSAGESSRSNPANATTFLSAPTGVRASDYNYNSISISWNPAPGATEYRIYRSLDALEYAEIGSTVHDNQRERYFYADTGLPINTTYYYRVTALNSREESPQSGTVNAIIILNAPTEVTAYSSTNGITVSWRNISNISEYKVYRSSNSLDYIEVGSASSSIGGTRTSYTDTGLSANTMYYYRVTAVSSGGESPQSGTVNATTLPN